MSVKSSTHEGRLIATRCARGPIAVSAVLCCRRALHREGTCPQCSIAPPCQNSRYAFVAGMVTRYSSDTYMGTIRIAKQMNYLYHFIVQLDQ